MHTQSHRLFLNFIFIALFAFIFHPLTFSSDPKDERALYMAEGVYQTDTSYTHLNGTDQNALDRFVLFKNGRKNSYTISISNSEFDTAFIVFNEVKVTSTNENFIFTGEATSPNGIFAEIKVTLNKKTKKFKGYLTDSIAEGYKTIEGSPLSVLGSCLYDPQNSNFQFPEFSKLMGIWEDEENNELIFREYSSKSISASIKYAVGGYAVFSDGIYDKKVGLASFLFSRVDRSSEILGKSAYAYRIDIDGNPYIKKLNFTTSGKVHMMKYYPKSKVLELPLY